MNEPNPYAPPKAPVADIGVAEPHAPRHVELACKLVWINLWLQVLNSLINIFSASGFRSVTAGIIDGLVGFGIAYLFTNWITRKLLARRNWMRWLITILNALSWLSLPVFWDFYVKILTPVMANPFVAVTLLLQSFIGIIAIVLLHTRPSRQWFGGGASTV